VPNLPEDALGRLTVGSAVAIEPFATEGPGRVAEEGEPQVFRVPQDKDPGPPGPTLPAGLREEIVGFRGLPFSRRDLRAFPRAEVETALRGLRERTVLQSYAPLVETTRRKVAQAEHTLLVTAAGVVVLAR
jgi:methionyl aminopeptidase